MSEIVFAASLANPKIRTILRSHVKEIKWNSRLAINLIEFLLSDKVSAAIPSMGELSTFLANNCSEEEALNIMAKIRDFLVIPDNAITNVINDFEEFYLHKKSTEILESQSRDKTLSPRELITAFSNIPKIGGNATPIINMGEVDVDKVIDEELGEGNVVPTTFEFIKRATPFGGYLKGQVVQVVAPPGVGKSNLLANEICNAIKLAQTEVYYMALGDMMKIDFITRLTSIITGEDYYKVALQPKKYFSEEVRGILKYLRVTVLPSGDMDASTMYDFIETTVSKERSIDIFALDYDANLAKSSDSMYEEGDITYNTLSRLSRPNNCPYRLVFVASQPKIQFWGDEELPKECSADSSRKQAIIDMMITIGKNNQIQHNSAGIIKAAKVRRGREGEKSHYKVSSCGHYIEISPQDYALLKSYSA